MPLPLVELALAVADSPLSLELLLGWGLAAPSELWAFLDEARTQGWITEDHAAGRGHFSICDEARRQHILETASSDALRALASHAELLGGMLSTARTLRKSATYRASGELFRVLICSVEPVSFPGGERGWVAAVLDSIRMFREMYGLSPSTVERAIAIAQAHGDVASQAVLIGAQGYRAFVEGRSREGREGCRIAIEVARGADPHTRTEVHGYLAVGLIRQGLISEGVAAFEELFGDVPDEIVSSYEFWFDSPGPSTAAPLGILADAYSLLGRHARAIDVMHRVLAVAEARNRPWIVAEAHMFLAGIYARQSSMVAAAHAEFAWDFHSERPDEPVYVWFSALGLAWVRVMQGRIEEVLPALAMAFQAHKRAGKPLLNGTFLYRIAERLGPDAIRGPEGFDLLEEAKRAAASDNVFASGCAHQFLASRLLAEPSSEARDELIHAHLERALDSLRAAGTPPQLASALRDAAEHCDRTGQVDRAIALREEQRRVLAQLPAAGAEAGNSQFIELVLALGRLAALRNRQDGFWGEIASRLSQSFGAERVALLELAPQPQVIGVRGGDRQWREEVLALLEKAPSRVAVFKSGEVTRVVVPFVSEEYRRTGMAVLENRFAPPLVGERDRALLSAVGAQLGVLFDNALMWKELAASRERLEQENRYFRESGPAQLAASGIVAHSAGMKGVFDLVSRVAPSNSTVLVLGETGVGKELIAHELHRRSARANGPFIAVHIASLAPGLVASSLFGHERGAFTGALEQVKGRFELADRGTIFLDEIGELPLEEQVRLLRVIQEGTFERVGGSRPIRSDFRLVAATNRNLEAEVKAGRFREDLFFRLQVFPIRVPPLRERRDEVPTLALMFMERFSRNLGRQFEGISETDMERLIAYAWPGNVRELEHVIERAVLLSDGPGLKIPALQSVSANQSEPEVAPGEWVTLEETERRYVAKVLMHTRGRITGAGGAAELLGLKPPTLNWRIDKLGLRDIVARVRRTGRGRGVGDG